MFKILILGCLCLIIQYLHTTDAQVRQRKPAPPARSVRKPAPARVLSQVSSKNRSRQQQMQLLKRKQSKKPPTLGHIKPATVRGYWDTEWCVEEPLGVFLHDECEMYWWCDEDGNIWEDWCDEGEVFDYEYFACTSVDDGGMCWAWVDGGEWNEECPEDPSELLFLPGDDCDHYFLCLNGYPQLLFCAPGQHWNSAMEYCDTPANAQCDLSIAPVPPNLPDCQGITGTRPHPFDCSLFIYCQANGSRLIQRCPHLLTYDVDLNVCRLNANCGTAFKKG